MSEYNSLNKIEKENVDTLITGSGPKIGGLLGLSSAIGIPLLRP